MKTKIITLLLALASSVGIMSKNVYPGVKIGNLYYDLEWDWDSEPPTSTATVAYQYQRAENNYSGLTAVNIPSSVVNYDDHYDVTSIGLDAFYGCTSLTSVTIPNSVTSIAPNAFYGCTSLTSVNIGNGVTSIEDSAFFDCSSLTSVTIPNSVTSIGDYAFYDCNGLTSVTIGNSVTSIGSGAFVNDSSLVSVTIPNSVTSIGDYAFYDCNGLTSMTIGNSVTSIGESAFAECSGLTSELIIPNSVTSIGGYAFSGCSGLTGELIIPNSVTSIGEYAFYDCSGLTGELIIPNSVTSIGDDAFSSCSGLASVTIGNSVTSIGEMAFAECSGLTSVTIGNSVTSIGSGAFGGCDGLTSVTIPNSVTSIGRYAFEGCTGLTSVTCEATTPPNLGYYVFNGVNCSSTTLYVPAGSVYAYKIADQWKDFYILPIGGREEEFDAITVRLAPTSATPWNKVYLYAWISSGNNTMQLCGSWPGTQVGTDSDGWWSYTFDEGPTNVNIIWTDGNGNQTVDINNVSASTCYSLNSTSGNKITVKVVDCQTVKNTYTIRFVNYDNTELLKLTDVEEGSIPEYTGPIPTRPNDEEYTYTFNGWTPTIVAATSDATYTATYVATPISEGIDDVQSDNVQCTKVIRDGQMYIIRGDKTYTLTGVEVK